MDFNFKINYDVNGLFQFTIDDETQNYISPELSYEQIYNIKQYLQMKLYEYDKLSSKTL